MQLTGNQVRALMNRLGHQQELLAEVAKHAATHTISAVATAGTDSTCLRLFCTEPIGKVCREAGYGSHGNWNEGWRVELWL